VTLPAPSPRPDSTDDSEWSLARPRHRRLVLPWGRIGVLVSVCGVALWAAGTPGGVSARVEDAWEWVQGGVERASADPQLRRAEDALDEWRARNGRYPDRSEFDPDNPTYGLPVGLSIQFCSPRHVVLSGMTSRGTMSRLLVDGERVGDVEGSPDCPVDPDAPHPWA
jgi:hypothetical protein